MKIKTVSLSSGDAFLQDDNSPTMIIVTILMEDGKTIQFPYDASKTLKQLDADILRAAERYDNRVSLREVQPIKIDLKPGGINHFESDGSPSPENTAYNKSTKIELEDIVECVKVYPRDPNIEASAIPVIGKQYRVFDKSTVQGIKFFEVLDDASDNKKLIKVYSDEVKLVAKRPPLQPGQERVMNFQTTHKCPCGEINALQINNEQNKYVGDCSCGRHLEVDRALPAK